MNCFTWQLYSIFKLGIISQVLIFWVLLLSVSISNRTRVQHHYYNDNSSTTHTPLSLQGEYVWVKPQNTTSEFAVPFGARIVRTEKTQTLICDDANKQYWVPAADVLKSMHITSQEDIEDMITLGDLQEYTILRNLQTRYAKKLIYVSMISNCKVFSLN